MEIKEFIERFSKYYMINEARLIKALSDYSYLLEKEGVIKLNNNSTEIIDGPALIDFMFEVKAGWEIFKLKILKEINEHANR